MAVQRSIQMDPFTLLVCCFNHPGFILVLLVRQCLTLKQANPDKLTSKGEYLVLGVVFVALCGRDGG
ncbi:MAG: hypothetical protein IPF93_14405 [Saprospiraceae bacterium]|nr:hypothetical protein [Saprospiraceae bacterium]